VSLGKVDHEWSDDPKPIQFVLCTRFKV